MKKQPHRAPRLVMPPAKKTRPLGIRLGLSAPKPSLVQVRSPLWKVIITLFQIVTALLCFLAVCLLCVAFWRAVTGNTDLSFTGHVAQ